MTTENVTHIHPSKVAKHNKGKLSGQRKGRFRDKTPEMYALLYLMDQSPYSDEQISDMTGINRSTIKKWREGDTRRAAPSSSRMVLLKIGVNPAYTDQNGNLIEIPGFLKLFFNFKG